MEITAQQNRTILTLKKLLMTALLSPMVIGPSLIFTAPAEASVPSCISRTPTHVVNGRSSTSVSNRCGYRKKVKVDWAWAKDTECVSLRNYFTTSRTKSWRYGNKQPYVRGLKSCS